MPTVLWRDDVLEYVFSYAPAPELPQTETDGRITVYRGMGELSQLPEKAISWTTNPINALWFANRSGRGTKLLVARVWPDKGILSYFSLFHDIGRDSEGEDESHGDKSVQWIRNKAIWPGGIYLSRKGYRMAELLIAYHLPG